ncbi:MAG: hypothetical protein AAF598_07610 [Bacteroidota bacterium]
MKGWMFPILFAAINLLLIQPAKAQNEPLPCLQKTFSVVVHIVKREDGTNAISNFAIQTNLDKLNQAFEPICVQFEICETNLIDNWQYDLLDDQTTNEWEELRTQNHRNNRINLYFVTRFEDQTQCGLATFGGISDMTTSGIALSKRNPCIGNDLQTISHYFGQFFGLPTTYDLGNELVDGSNCTTTGDQICDTSADPYLEGDDPSSYINGNCQFTSNGQDANGQYFTPDVGNIMSAYLGCRCRFSFEQYRLMALNYLNAPDKMW